MKRVVRVSVAFEWFIDGFLNEVANPCPTTKWKTEGNMAEKGALKPVLPTPANHYPGLSKDIDDFETTP